MGAPHFPRNDPAFPRVRPVTSSTFFSRPQGDAPQILYILNLLYLLYFLLSGIEGSPRQPTPLPAYG